MIGIEKVPAKDAHQFELLEPGSNRMLYKIHRVRCVDEIPVMHEWIWLACSRFPRLSLDVEQFPELLYVHLLEEYGVRISAVREEVHAECADAEDRKLLDIDGEQAAVLCVDAKAFDQANDLTIISKHRALSNGFKYVSEIR